MCKMFNFLRKQLKKIEDFCASIKYEYNNCKIIKKKIHRISISMMNCEKYGLGKKTQLLILYIFAV